jgi:hypothetical protein
MTITITVEATRSSYISYAIFDVTGSTPTIVTGQTHALVDTVASTSITAGPLPAAATSGNLVICAAGANRDSGTVVPAPSGFTTLGTPPSGGGQFELERISYSTTFSSTSTTYSNDPDDLHAGNVLFEIANGAGGVTLTGATTATPSFTAPTVAVDTDLTFRLTVTDADGQSSQDTVVVTVHPAGGITVNPRNFFPVL